MSKNYFTSYGTQEMSSRSDYLPHSDVLTAAPTALSLLSVSPGEKVTMFEFTEKTEGQPQAPILITHYLPGHRADATFRLILRKQPNTRAAIVADFVGDHRRFGLWRTSFPISSAGDFSFICGDQLTGTVTSP